VHPIAHDHDALGAQLPAGLLLLLLLLLLLRSALAREAHSVCSGCLPSVLPILKR
jgi:hypothetical protein